MFRGLLRVLACLIFGQCLLCTNLARAEDVSAAREHFRRGTVLYDLRRYHEAAKEYEKAFEAKDDPALLFNIAQAYRFAGEYDDAIGAFRSYLRRLPQAPNRAEVEQRLAELQQLSEARKHSERSPPTGTLAPIHKPPAEAEPSAETSTSTSPSTMAPPAPVVTSTTGEGIGSTERNRRRLIRNVGFGLVGGGAALLVSGVVFGVLTQSASDSLTNPTAGQRFDPAVSDQGKTFQVAEIATLSIGGVLAIAGTAMVVVGARKTPQRQSATATQQVSAAAY
jgi:tetratricopeptide (TPR) repeat protein